MKLLISDTSICIDLYFGNLLNKISKLPYHVGISDAILSELKEPSYGVILTSGFQVYSIISESVADVYLLATKYPKLSTQDLFSLVTARDYNAILLTGDKDLRKAAVKQDIETKGILWVIDELLHYNIINKKTAFVSLKVILDKGARLPKNECEKRFIEWQK